MDGSIFKHNRMLGVFFPWFLWYPYRITLEIWRDPNVIMLVTWSNISISWHLILNKLSEAESYFLVLSNLCQNFEILMYFKRFPFTLDTILSLSKIEANNFFQPTTTCKQLFYEKGNPSFPGKVQLSWSQNTPVLTGLNAKLAHSYCTNKENMELN